MGRKGMVLNLHFGKIILAILKDNLEWVNKTLIFGVSKEYGNDGRDG